MLDITVQKATFVMQEIPCAKAAFEAEIVDRWSCHTHEGVVGSGPPRWCSNVRVDAVMDLTALLWFGTALQFLEESLSDRLDMNSQQVLHALLRVSMEKSVTHV
jgi:hypothetical protein